MVTELSDYHTLILYWLDCSSSQALSSLIVDTVSYLSLHLSCTTHSSQLKADIANEGETALTCPAAMSQLKPVFRNSREKVKSVCTFTRNLLEWRLSSRPK